MWLADWEYNLYWCGRETDVTLIDQVVIFLNLLFSTFIFYSGTTDMYTMEYTTVSFSCSPTFKRKKIMFNQF